MFTKVSNNLSPIKLAHLALKLASVPEDCSTAKALILPAYHMIALNSFGILSFIDLYFGNEPLPVLIQALSSLTVYLHVHAKAWNLHLNRKQIRKLIGRVEDLRLEILQDEASRQYITETDSFSTKFVLFYGSILLMNPLLSLIINCTLDYILASERPHLVMQIWIPWSMKEHRFYLAGMVLSMILSVSSIIHYTANCIIQLFISFQLSAFLQALQARVERQEPADLIIYKHHSRIIELLNDYNNLFAGQMQFEILLSSLQPCGYGYTLIKGIKKNEPDIFDQFYKCLLATTAPFILCACGQQISTQMDRLHQSTYMGKWYEEKPKIRSNLVIMSSITVKPSTFCYKRIFKFDFVCFAAVAQGIYTYLTMISNFETSE